MLSLCTHFVNGFDCQLLCLFHGFTRRPKWKVLGASWKIFILLIWKRLKAYQVISRCFHYEKCQTCSELQVVRFNLTYISATKCPFTLQLNFNIPCDEEYRPKIIIITIIIITIIIIIIIIIITRLSINGWKSEVLGFWALDKYYKNRAVHK